jgi:ABC-type phosphate transport system permease subunit
MELDNNPYSAPAINVYAFTDSVAPPVLVSKALRYDNETIIKILIVLFVLGAVAAIFGVVYDAIQISLLSNSTINPEEAEWNDVRQGISADTVPLFLSSTWVTLVADVLDVPLCIVAMSMLMRIQRSQVEWVKSPTKEDESQGASKSTAVG